MIKFFVLLFAVSFHSAFAGEIKRQELLKEDVKKETEKVQMQKITMPPGQAAPVHSHPCPVVGHVLKGEIKYTLKGQAPKILKPGDAFYEPANAVVESFNNNSQKEEAEFVAVYLIGKDDKALITITQ